MSTYVNADAFCLMRYKCKNGHVEIVWNSRDGVTPFTIDCIPCAAAFAALGKTTGRRAMYADTDALHVNWNEDIVAPGHALKPGQRYFRDGTLEKMQQPSSARASRQPQAPLGGCRWQSRTPLSPRPSPIRMASFSRGGRCLWLRYEQPCLRRASCAGGSSRRASAGCRDDAYHPLHAARRAQFRDDLCGHPIGTFSRPCAARTDATLGGLVSSSSAGLPRSARAA